MNPPEAEPIQPGSEAAAKALDAAVSVQEQIALLAYSYWECRGCEGGSAEDDWLRAEREILSRLQSEAGTR